MFYYAIIGLVGFGILGWIVSIHNNLVQVRNNADKNWINIDVVLLQRNEELGKLIDTCKGYMAHEAGLLAKLTEMRSRYGAEKNLVQKAATENDIQGAMSRLQQVWEAYPDLRATENFQQVQRRISALESTITDRRELFNDSVNIFNIRIETFPARLVAQMLGYRHKRFLEVPSEAKADRKMDFTQEAGDNSEG